MMTELVFDAQDVVGESVLWDDRRERLVWVDIIGRRIHALDPTTGAHRLWLIEARPTSIALCLDGSALVGTERHICAWSWHGEPRPLVEVEPDLPDNRLNEGAAGPDGAFWVGSMQQNIAPDDSPRDITAAAGRLYRYAPDGRLSQVSDDLYGIANTLVWPEPNRLVVADTTKNSLFQCSLRPDGRLGPRDILSEGFDRGLPDGSCMDAEGGIWTARVAGGACLTRTGPDGQVDRVADLPCSWPTSCTFGGPDLDKLYVTSARFTMASAHLAAHPLEGALFALKPGVSGCPAHRFGAPP